MRKLIALLIVLSAAAGLGYAIAIHPGRASLDWLGWRVDTTAAAALVFGFGASVVLAALWRFLGWLASAPARTARRRGHTQRERALESLTGGFLALAAGDAAAAEREARTATTLDEAAPALAWLLAAQAAEVEGDDPAAQLAYAQLLNDPQSRPAGQRGLRRLALRRGDAAGQEVDPEPDAPLSLGG